MRAGERGSRVLDLDRSLISGAKHEPMAEGEEAQPSQNGAADRPNGQVDALATKATASMLVSLADRRRAMR